MYGNTPPTVGVAVPGVLATTGLGGFDGLGVTFTALVLVVCGALLLRSAFLRRASEPARG